MYHRELKELIELVLRGDIEKNNLLERIINSFDCEKIYDSDDELLTDSFFTLKHYASNEEIINDEEWLYFLDCLDGKRKYSMKEKMSITRNH